MYIKKTLVQLKAQILYKLYLNIYNKYKII